MCSLILFLTEADSVQFKGNIFYFISLIKQRNIPGTQEDVVNIISSYLCTTFENLWVFLRSWGHRPAPFCREPLECPRSVDPTASQAGMYIPSEVPERVFGILDATVLLEIRSRCSEFLSSVKSCLTCIQEQKQEPNGESIYIANENVVLLWFGGMRCC